MKISLIVIAKDAEKILPRCLVSAAWMDERIVVDSGSADRTGDVARAGGAKVFERPFDTYAHQKNFALSNATGDWVVSLDADEWLTDELVAELKERLSRADSEAGFHVPMKTYYFGRWLRHGGFWPDFHLRVFRRERGRCESRGKDVHEGFHVDGPVGTLRHPIAHDAYPTLRGYIAKFNRYTDMEMEGWVSSGRPLRGYDLFVRPLHRWMKRYILKAGWRDGIQGLLACSFAAAYEFIVALKVYEKSPVSAGRLMATLLKRS